MLQQAIRTHARCWSLRALHTRTHSLATPPEGCAPESQRKVVRESRCTQALPLAIQIQQFTQITANLHRLASDMYTACTRENLFDAATRAKSLPMRLDLIVEKVAARKNSAVGAFGGWGYVNPKAFLTGGAVGSIAAVCCGCPIDMVSFLSHPDGTIAGLSPKFREVTSIGDWAGAIMMKRGVDYVRCKIA